MPKKKQYVDKKEAMKIHFNNALIRRYKLFLNYKEKLQIVDDIQSGKSLYVRRRVTSRAEHIVNVNGTKVLVVYDNNHKILVTALPKKMLKEAELFLERKSNGNQRT